MSNMPTHSTPAYIFKDVYYFSDLTTIILAYIFKDVYYFSYLTTTILSYTPMGDNAY